MAKKEPHAARSEYGSDPVANSDPVKVGVLYSRAGITSRIESSQLVATQFAIREINDAGGIDGRELVLVHYDPESSPLNYKTLATRLVRDDNVHVILGCYMSSTRKAVIPVVEKWHASADLSDVVRRASSTPATWSIPGAAPNQNSVQLAEFMLRTLRSRVFWSARTTSTLRVESHHERPHPRAPGGEGRGALPARSSAVGGLPGDRRRRSKAAPPDFIFSTVVGDGTALLHRAYAKVGLDPARMPIASLTTCEAEISKWAPASPTVTSRRRPTSSPSTATRIALASHVAVRCSATRSPNMGWEAAYFQIHLVANAMRKARTDEREHLLPALLGSEFVAPQGLVRIDPRQSSHPPASAHRPGRSGRSLRRRGGGTARVRPDPYLVDHTSTTGPRGVALGDLARAPVEKEETGRAHD